MNNLDQRLKRLEKISATKPIPIPPRKIDKPPPDPFDAEDLESILHKTIKQERLKHRKEQLEILKEHYENITCSLKTDLIKLVLETVKYVELNSKTIADLMNADNTSHFKLELCRSLCTDMLIPAIFDSLVETFVALLYPKPVIRTVKDDETRNGEPIHTELVRTETVKKKSIFRRL
jgi:hypothetical protein